MRRRDFLRVAAHGAATAALSPLAVPAQAAAPNLRAALADGAWGKIDERMRQLLLETKVPGASLAIVQEGRLAWHRAFGVLDTKTQTPVDADTVFEAASVSKTAFAYVALKLCEQGTLGLDTPLTRYTKHRFFAGDPRLDQVTARHVLAHTTGFPEWRSGEPPLKILGQPGARFLYSGEGYFYLQSVVTELVGRSFAAPCGRYEADLEVCATDFDDFMRRTLLNPMDMKASGYGLNERFAAHAAHPHDLQGRPLPLKKPNAADIARYGAAGELRTTATDYAKFLSAVLSLPVGDAFLGAAMHAEMVRPQVKLDPAANIDGADSWALGWAVQERPTGHVILHSGGQPGFRSLTMASVARKSGFVIFTNSDNGGHICHDRVLRDMLDPLLGG